LARSIFAHTVGDQDLHFHSAEILPQSGGQKRPDVPDFIAARDNDRDMRLGCGMDCSFLPGKCLFKKSAFSAEGRGS